VRRHPYAPSRAAPSIAEVCNYVNLCRGLHEPSLQQARPKGPLGGAALAISITILCCNMLGDGLRDALDPRLRQ